MESCAWVLTGSGVVEHRRRGVQYIRPRIGDSVMVSCGGELAECRVRGFTGSRRVVLVERIEGRRCYGKVQGSMFDAFMRRISRE